jgi:hypothetical protein
VFVQDVYHSHYQVEGADNLVAQLEMTVLHPSDEFYARPEHIIPLT